MNQTNTATATEQQKPFIGDTAWNIKGIAMMAEVTPEDAHRVLLTVRPEDLRNAKCALQVLTLFMKAGGDKLVTPELNESLMKTVFVSAITGNFGPEVDLSELIAEAEQAQATVH